jgi:exopolyphosphatase/pppGpp-phosphohydrolase
MYFPFATSAVREANNQEFLKEIDKEMGFRL